VSEESRHVWDLADQVGFFVIGKVGEPGSSALTGELGRHPCCLGWLLTGAALPADLARAPLLGVVFGTALPEAATFLAVPAGETPPHEVGLPVLLLGGDKAEDARAFKGPDTQGAEQVVLGVVEP
jgi:hypothetical protein